MSQSMGDARKSRLRAVYRDPDKQATHSAAMKSGAIARHIGSNGWPVELPAWDVDTCCCGASVVRAMERGAPECSNCRADRIERLIAGRRRAAA